jgi:hypothetical protein
VARDSPVPLLQLLQFDVLELNAHGRTHVDLKGKDAFLGGLGWIFIGDIDRSDIIDLLDDVVALDGDGVSVPVVLLDGLENLFGSSDRASDVFLSG